MKIMTVYDGTGYGKRALRYAIQKAGEKGAELIAIHVFDRDLFLVYDAVPRVEDFARKESSHHISEVEEIIKTEGKGLKASIYEIEGNPEREIVKLAKEEQADLLFVPPRLRSVKKKSPCPVSVIPGTILVPVDHSTEAIVDLGHLVSEARATASAVLLLGIIPIHLYSRDEKDEIDRITLQTSITVKGLWKILTEKGIDTKEVIRSGYPDEEILKAADENNVSMIVFLTGNKKPSELAKAETIIQDERQRLRVPVFDVPAHWQPA